MNIFAGLETFLYIISSALFYPVVAGLVLLVFWMVISFGGFLREFVDRVQGISLPFRRYQLMLELMCKNNNKAELDINLERLLQASELDMVKSLDKIRFAIRVGPALGLMGTLIPMGVALSALSQGDMTKMAGNMVTAFTATVVGLACSVAAYLMSTVKEKWLRADMREMEYLTELTLRNAECK
ncbi:MotA/TolQ/ExbB proton channel family protein [Candidatus Desantisbacteria bacterium]|nr:MotA/TolQ/ExbB proton channel family protein [Candidatus Desantisbacteria bacterium]